jgi:hypothetical protein
VSCIDFGQMLPLPKPVSPITNPAQFNQDRETFMIQNGVTQEEIKEFHRLRMQIGLD